MPHSSIVINKKSAAPSILQTKSLQFDGSYNMVTPVDDQTSVGITDTFSLAIWAKYENQSPAADELLTVGASISGANRLAIAAVSGSKDNLRILFADQSTSFKQFKVWNDVIKGDTDTWVHYVITFGGATGNGANGVKLYTQSIDRGAPSSTTLDLAGTYTDTDRGIRLGSDVRWTGPIYSVAIYNTVLAQSNITAMHNNGNARDLDLTKNFGNYTASANLLHYFRLGLGTTEAEFGTDRVAVGSDLSLIHSAGSAPDETDLTTDIPL